jgi:predicted dehydrogenase
MLNSRVGVGIIGYGYWGPNLVRNFVEVPDAQVATVCDANPKRLALVQRRYPSLKTTTDYQELLQDSAVNAVVIATPVSTHFELAMRGLKAGKHVLVEKPITSNSQEALQLIEEAERRGLVLMVDHTFVYTSAVAKIRELVRRNSLGQIYYYDAVRVNLGLFQHDVSVVWDLAVHDLSIMGAVLSQRPSAVSCAGISHVPGEPENIAYITLFFDSNLVGHIHVNWLAPVKLRTTLISGSEKMIVYDDVPVSEKVKVYDKGIAIQNGSAENIYRMLISYRAGDVWIPTLDVTEALYTEAVHFVHCIQTRERPLTDGEAGLQVVRILEAATESMKNRGRLIELARGKAAAWSLS